MNNNNNNNNNEGYLLNLLLSFARNASLCLTGWPNSPRIA
jgi:hypothetical protein